MSVMASKSGSHMDIHNFDHYDTYMDGYVVHNRACDKHERYHNEHRGKLSTLSGHPTIGVTNIPWGNVAIERRSGNRLLFLRKIIIGSHDRNHYNLYKVVDLQVMSKTFQKSVNP